MTIKASGRAALILATGLFVWFAGPSQAATDEDEGAVSTETPAGPPIALNRYANPGPRHRRHHASRRSSKVALKSSASTKASEVGASDNSPAISPSVANAKAQMNAIETPTANGEAAMSVRANDVRQAAADNSMDAPPPAKGQIVSADQLNDADRALQESKPIAAAFAMASVGTAATTGSNESSTWDRTSQIGKIFIGLGVLLTMASAARMFMA
jgi:hypothetical protein